MKTIFEKSHAGRSTPNNALRRFRAAKAAVRLPR